MRRVHALRPEFPLSALRLHQADPVAADDPHLFLDDPLTYLMRGYQRHGATAFPAPGRENFVFALGPDHNREIYLNPDRYVATGFLFPGPKNSAQRRLLAGIFNQNGERHRDQRRIMMPTFQKAAVGELHEAMSSALEVHLSSWDFGQTRDLSAELLAFVAKLNGRLLLGIDADDLVVQLEAATEDWMALNTPLTVAGSLSLDLPRSWYDAALASSERVEALTRQVLDERRKRSLSGRDLLAHLIQAHADDPQRLTELELVGQTAHLFAASNQSTRSSLIWTLILLAQHPHVVHELHDELQREARGEAITSDVVDRLQWLDWIYKESIRLFPPVSYYTRALAEPTELSHRRWPKGTTIVFSHYVTHRIESVFPEPNRFLPERWKTAKPTPFEYLPFGIGPRMCIGYSYASLLARLVLATMLRRFNFTIVPGTRIGRKITTILSPRPSVPMRLGRPGESFGASFIEGEVAHMFEQPKRHAIAA